MTILSLIDSFAVVDGLPGFTLGCPVHIMQTPSIFASLYWFTSFEVG